MADGKIGKFKTHDLMCQKKYLRGRIKLPIPTFLKKSPTHFTDISHSLFRKNLGRKLTASNKDIIQRIFFVFAF